jgi:hypothetical protein
MHNPANKKLRTQKINGRFETTGNVGVNSYILRVVLNFLIWLL